MCRKQAVRGMDAVARIRAQPYGCDLDSTTGKRVINEVEAEVVVRVFGLYAEGLSLFRIAKLRVCVEGVRARPTKLLAACRACRQRLR